LAITPWIVIVSAVAALAVGLAAVVILAAIETEKSTENINKEHRPVLEAELRRLYVGPELEKELEDLRRRFPLRGAATLERATGNYVANAHSQMVKWEAVLIDRHRDQHFALAPHMALRSPLIKPEGRRKCSLGKIGGLQAG
jgi:hypothetical protein